MEQAPRLGDRSSRDDRYLFLETSLRPASGFTSATSASIRITANRLLRSYCELMDYIEQGFELPGHMWTTMSSPGTACRLSAALISGAATFSLAENLRASQIFSPAPAPFISSPGRTGTGAAAATCKPWRNSPPPGQVFGHATAGDNSFRMNANLCDQQPDGYLLKEELLELRLADLRVQDSRQLIRASGRLPAGIAGDIHYAAGAGCRSFFRQLQP
jgi:hypothetical protein